MDKAKLISIVLSPHLFSVFIAYLYWKELLCLGGMIQLIAMIFFVSVLPFIFILIDRLRGKIDIFVTKRKDRPKYYLLTLLSYQLGSLFSLITKAQPYILFYICYTVVGISLLIFNNLTKISVHAAGIAGPTTMMWFLFNSHYYILYLLLIPVAWSRIKLNAHTFIQIISGTLVAPIVTLISLMFFNSLGF